MAGHFDLVTGDRPAHDHIRLDAGAGAVGFVLVWGPEAVSRIRIELSSDEVDGGEHILRAGFEPAGW